MGSARVGDLTWDKVGKRLLSGCDAILPVGAGSKEHGLHLPLNTDLIQAEWLAVKLAEQSGALVWPTISYGHYPAFRDYPGSVSISEELFERLMCEIIADVCRFNPRRLYVLDTGISTIPAVARAVAHASGAVPLIHLKVYDGPRYKAATADVRQQAYGSHADELETSRMLVIAPEVVDLARAEASPGSPFKGPLTRALSPSGSYGDPTLASREKGERLVAAMLEDLAAQLIVPKVKE